VSTEWSPWNSLDLATWSSLHFEKRVQFTQHSRLQDRANSKLILQPQVSSEFYSLVVMKWIQKSRFFLWIQVLLTNTFFVQSLLSSSRMQANSKLILQLWMFNDSVFSALLAMKRFVFFCVVQILLAILCFLQSILSCSCIQPPKNGLIALWPNTRVVKFKYDVSHKRNESIDVIQWYNILLSLSC